MKNDGTQTSREVQVSSSPAEHLHDQTMDQSIDDHSANMSHSMHDHAKDHGGQHGHVNHSGHEQIFRQRFWVCLLLTIPVLLFSPMIQTWFGFSMPEFAGSTLIGPAFAIAIFLYGGLPFLQMAVPEIQNRQPGMMLLISLAITVSFVYSLFALVAVPGSGLLLGDGDPDRHHAARSLDGDAQCAPGVGSARRIGEADARHRRTDRRGRQHRNGTGERSSKRAT